MYNLELTKEEYERMLNVYAIHCDNIDDSIQKAMEKKNASKVEGLLAVKKVDKEILSKLLALTPR